MSDIYRFKSAHLVIKDHLAGLGDKENHGAHKKLASALGIFPSYLSLILRGERALNLDQGMLLADYLKLKKTERRYLLRIIELDRAQTQKLKDELEQELNEIASRGNQIASNVEIDSTSLSASEEMEFFSSWTYSATHLFAAVMPQLTPATISKKFRFDVDEAKKIYRFLIKVGLWKKVGNQIKIVPKFIHLDETSQALKFHHANWRLRAIERHHCLDREKELGYSLTVALSESDAIKIRSLLLSTISDLRKISDPSKSEVLYNLNLDWLRI